MCLRRILVIVLSLLASTSVWAQNRQDKITWGHIAPTAFYWDVYAARSLGFMDKQKLNVEAINIDAASQSIQMVLTGAVDILSSATELALNAIDKGGDLVIIGNETARVSWALMARPEITTIADLKGKVVGVSQLKDSSTTLSNLIIERGGVKPSEYQIIQLGGTPNRYAALTRGAIQATLLVQPADFRAEQDGMRRLGAVEDVFDGPAIVFVARRTWAQQNAALVERFLRGAVQGMRWLDNPENKQQAIEVLVKTIGGSPELATKTYDYYLSKQVMSKDGSLPLQHLTNYLALSREAPGSIDTTKYVDLSYLKRAQAP
jgi:ABC-type nitrate/sulfonate/bicarbonate transport system substrate-binding protein